MKSFVLLLGAGILTPCVFGVTATIARSDQNMTLTGLGGDGTTGDNRITWGACSFDGSNTVCRLTGSYTGVGGGGTFISVLTYSGNGPSPLTGRSIGPGNDNVLYALSAGSLVISLTENIGGTVTFLANNVAFQFINPTCTGVSVCRVGLVGITPNATITGPVTGTFDATPNIQNVISASNYGGFSAVAPATWMEIYGTNLANVETQTWSGADFNGNRAPTTLGGTSVTIGGQPAFTYYVSPGQINAQVPSNIGTGSQPVVVTTPGGTSVARNVTVNATQPGLLAPAVFTINGSRYIAALFPDGTTFVLPPGVTTGVATARAKPGDTIILYGVGFGPVTPDSPAGQIETTTNRLAANFQISFAGVPATVAFSGLTGGYLGLYQFNVVVPNVGVNDKVPVTFSLAGAPGPQQLVIPIGN